MDGRHQPPVFICGMGKLAEACALAYEIRMSGKPEHPVLLAVIGAPHGVKGEVRVKSFTGDPVAFSEYGMLRAGDGRQFEVIDARPSKTVVIARFKGVDTREKAEALNGTELFVDRSALPETEGEDEFYLEDLTGLEAVTQDGKRFGVVLAVHDFGAGDILEIALAKGGGALFAFTREIFPEIDLAGGRIVIVPPAEVSEREP